MVAQASLFHVLDTSYVVILSLIGSLIGTDDDLPSKTTATTNLKHSISFSVTASGFESA